MMSQERYISALSGFFDGIRMKHAFFLPRQNEEIPFIAGHRGTPSLRSPNGKRL